MADEKESDEILENPPELKGVWDLSMLVYLKMYHVLVNLKARYSEMNRKHPYTSISTVLIAINPYEMLPIYGHEVIEEFHEKQKEFLSVKGKPHPFGVASRAYQRMVHRGIAQSTIVCGESGAGKSETAKQIMRYLASTSTVAGEGQSVIEGQIIAASPILEAFGNAKTIWNNNSSRFGKFTKLLYERVSSSQANILGAYLETYLLEKSRVVFQAKNERNFHCFYFVHAGLEEDVKKDMGLGDITDFHYANQGKGKSHVVPGISDRARFTELQQSLKIMRVAENQQGELWEIIGAILHLGNIMFTKGEGDFAEVDMDKTKVHVELASKYFGVEVEAFTNRLTLRGIKVRNQTIMKKIPFPEAIANASAIAKAIYDNMFLWLCKRINSELFQDDVEDRESLNFIGILDVFGFENFPNNSLEQMCINFTNEKLQAFFNENIIKSEQEEYIKESVFWTPLDVPDNEECIGMIEDKEKGFFRLMDDQTRNKPSTEALYEFLFKYHAKNKKVKRAKPPKRKKGGKKTKYYGITVHHYAEPVIYNLDKFLEKNADAIHPDTQKMFKKSSNSLAKEVGGKKWVGAGGGKKKKKKKGFTSVVSVFHKGITTLMKNLQSTEPYFVRCVNPNKNKSPKEWDEAHVEKQLRCGGLVEALAVLTLGYPTRVPYDTLYDKFHGVIDNPLIKQLQSAAFAEAILVAWEVTRADYELGLTKIFFKPAKAAILDEILDMAGKPLTKEQNDRITKWVVGKRVRQVFGSIKTMAKCVQMVKKLRGRQNWNKWGRIIGMVAITWIRQLDTARASLEKKRREEASKIIGCYWRGFHNTKKTQKAVTEKREAAQYLVENITLYKQRQAFFKWLNTRVEESREIKRKLAAKRLAEEKALKERLEKEAEERRKKEEEARKAAKDEAERKALKEKQEREAAAADEKARKELEEKQERERIEQEQKLAEQRKKDAEEQRKKDEAEAARLEAEAKKRQEDEAAAAALAREKAAAEIEEGEKQTKEQEKARKKKAKEERRAARAQNAEANKKERRQKKREHMDKLNQDEEDAAEERGQRHAEEMMPEIYNDEESDEGSDAGSSDEDSDTDTNIKQDFSRAAGTGQLFLKHTGKRRRKPQDRFVKVSFEKDGTAKTISWGSGSRHINFDKIRTVTWGHWTPVFLERKDTLDPHLCFSVISNEQVLDLQAPDRSVAELWVLGLRALLSIDPLEADNIAQTMKEKGEMPGLRVKGRSSKLVKGDGKDRRTSRRDVKKKDHKKRTKSLMLLQQDLFVMTCTTVFRNIEEEGQYTITQNIRDRFNAKELYEEALSADIPWRQWNHWVRSKVLDYLKRSADPDHDPNDEDEKCTVM